MAIQSRRGNIANFDANKMLPGEFACALDTGELFYCVSPGNVKRCATKEELQQILTATPEAYTALQELIANLQNQTVLTGILNDISNLKSTKLALTGDSKTNTTTFTEASKLANINSTETHATLFGKIKKFFSFVGTTTLTTTAQTISAATNEILAANRSGWSAILATDKLTYKSASAPTFVCNTLNTSNAEKDMRPYLSVGMKLKITQDAVVKYFFVTAIDATSITLYGGTDYVLTNTAITNVCYSVVKSPYGFPQTFNKIKTMTLDRSANAIGSQPVTIGFRPKFLKITAYCPGAGNGFESIGTFDGSYEVCTFRITLQGNTQNTIVAMHSGGSVFQANASFTDFGFVLTWSNIGSIPAGTVKMLIEIL